MKQNLKTEYNKVTRWQVGMYEPGVKFHDRFEDEQGRRRESTKSLDNDTQTHLPSAMSLKESEYRATNVMTSPNGIGVDSL